MVKYNHNYGKINMIPIRSKVTIKILNYFFLNPTAKHYINELAKMLDLDPKNVDRKLKELEKQGFLKSEFSGKQRYFSLIKNSPTVKNYRPIFLKIYGLEQKLKDLLAKEKKIEEAYLFGSYVEDKMDFFSDIDLLIIGSHSSVKLQKIINKLQKEAGREINIINMSKKEFKNKQKQKDALLKNILTNANIRLV